VTLADRTTTLRERTDGRRSRRSRYRVLAALTMVATLAGTLTATPAAADPITTLVCQGWNARAVINFTSPPTADYQCSGTFTPPNRGVVRFTPAAWSGYFVWGGQRQNFCDYDDWRFSGDVYLPFTTLYMAPSRAPWC
jgi:hypothetical protein